MNEKHFCLLRLSRTDNALPLSFSASFSPPQCFWKIGEIGAKKILQNNQRLIHFSYLLLLKDIFLVYFFSEQNAVKRNSPDTT